MFPDQKINVFAEEANFFVLVLTSTCLLLFLHSSNIMQENQWKVFFFQWGHLIVLRWVKYLPHPLTPHPLTPSPPPPPQKESLYTCYHSPCVFFFSISSGFSFRKRKLPTNENWIFLLYSCKIFVICTFRWQRDENFSETSFPNYRLPR